MADVVNTPDFAQQFFDLDGKPLVNGKLAFFKNNTDIPASVSSSDGSVSLGSEITLDASGFPSTQFSLLAGLEYTVKAFDSNNVLLWTRNNVFGSGEGSGDVGNWVPMEGTTAEDPIRGNLVLKEDHVQNTVSRQGVTLQNETGGSTSLVRDGLTVAISNSTADYGATSVNLQNTQNGFPGYPDYALMNLRNLQLHREIEDSGRKEKSLSLSVDSSVYNMMESKGAHLNVKSDKSFMVQASGIVNLMGNAEGTTPSIELNPTTNGVVYVGNNGSLVTKRFGIGTSLNNKEVNDIWTSTSTGAMTDDQLITAKAAYDMSGGGSSHFFNEPFGALVDGYFELNIGTSGKLAFFGRTAIRNTTIKSVLIATFGSDTNPYAEVGVYALRSNRALTLLGKETSYTLTPDGSMVFNFQTPVQVGDEVIFIGVLCGPTNTWSSGKCLFLNTNSNSSMLTGMNANATVFKNTTDYPVMASPFTGQPNGPYKDIVSRRGFYWQNFSLSALPASTTSNDWSTSGSVLMLPYCAVECVG